MAIGWIEQYEPEIRDKLNWIRLCRTTDMEKWFRLCNELHAYAEEKHDVTIDGAVHYYIAEYYYVKMDRLKAVEHCQKALAALPHSNSPRLHATACNLLGIIHMWYENYEASIDAFMQGVEISVQNEFWFTSGMLHSNITCLYTELGDYENAIASSLKAWEDYSRETDEPDYQNYCLAENRYNIALALLALDRIEEAADYMAQMESYVQRIPQNYDAQLNLLMLRAVYALKIHDDSSFRALLPDIYECFQKASNYADMINSISALLETCYEETGAAELPYLPEIMEKLLTAEVPPSVRSHLLRLKWKLCPNKNQENAVEMIEELIEAFDAQQTFLQESKRLSVKLMLQKEATYSNTKKWIQMASQDALTQLWNRRYFEDVFEQYMKQALEEQKPIAFAIMDIDYFKEYNDHYGHSQGDTCLRSYAQILNSLRLDTVSCARYGGDEFLLLSVGSDEKFMDTFMKRFYEKLREAAIPHEYSPISGYVTSSCGIYIRTPKKEEKLNFYLQQADVLLYQVKRNGKNSYLIKTEDGLS